MDSLDLDQVIDEIIPRDQNSKSRPVDLTLRPTLNGHGAEDADAALALVSEAAEAIRKLEEQSAQAVARAHSAANAVMEKLERTVERAERAESALRQAEIEINELTANAMQAHEDLEMLRSVLAARENDLASMENRAEAAEKRAEEANAAIQRIVGAIRTQLPVSADADADSDQH
ncbi:MAG: ABC transporter permease [Chloroflexota bacterium]|jgi:chromosome segregation ATPase